MSNSTLAPATSAAARAPVVIDAKPGPHHVELTADGYDLGALPDPAGFASLAGAGAPVLDQLPDGRVLLTVRHTRIWNLELTSLETLRPLATDH